MNINNFLSNISGSEFEGILKSSFFQTIINPPKVLLGVDAGLMSYRVLSISLPGVSFVSSENIKYYSLGPMYYIPYNVIQTDIGSSLILDSGGNLYKFFFDWMNKIVKFDNVNNVLDTTSYDVEYFDNIVTTVETQIFDSGGNLTKKVYLYEAYPISIDPIPVNWSTVDDYALLNVNFKFISWSLQ